MCDRDGWVTSDSFLKICLRLEAAVIGLVVRKDLVDEEFAQLIYLDLPRCALLGEKALCSQYNALCKKEIRSGDRQR